MVACERVLRAEPPLSGPELLKRQLQGSRLLRRGRHLRSGAWRVGVRQPHQRRGGHHARRGSDHASLPHAEGLVHVVVLDVQRVGAGARARWSSAPSRRARARATARRRATPTTYARRAGPAARHLSQAAGVAPVRAGIAYVGDGPSDVRLLARACRAGVRCAHEASRFRMRVAALCSVADRASRRPRRCARPRAPSSRKYAVAADHPMRRPRARHSSQRAATRRTRRRPPCWRSAWRAPPAAVSAAAALRSTTVRATSRSRFLDFRETAPAATTTRCFARVTESRPKTAKRALAHGRARGRCAGRAARHQRAGQALRQEAARAAWSRRPRRSRARASTSAPTRCGCSRRPGPGSCGDPLLASVFGEQPRGDASAPPIRPWRTRCAASASRAPACSTRGALVKQIVARGQARRAAS